MIRRFAVALLAVAAVSFVAAPAQAGGTSGGTKRSVSIKTYNQNGADVVVVPLSSKQIKQIENGDLDLPTTVSQAKSSKWGGVQIADGSSKTVKAPSGVGQLWATTFDADTGELNPEPIGFADYNLSAGTSTTASVNPDSVTIPREPVN